MIEVTFNAAIAIAILLVTALGFYSVRRVRRKDFSEWTLRLGPGVSIILQTGETTATGEIAEWETVNTGVTASPIGQNQRKLTKRELRFLRSLVKASIGLLILARIEKIEAQMDATVAGLDECWRSIPAAEDAKHMRVWRSAGVEAAKELGRDRSVKVKVAADDPYW